VSVVKISIKKDGYIYKMSKIKCNGRLYDSYNTIDFIDIGCSKGGSYKAIKKRFNFESGLAIDIDIRKVNESLKNNTPAIRLDATQMGIFNDNSCKLISMVHTLEHLPNMKIIEDVLKESVRVASETLYINGPMFYLDYLSKRGFQFYWSNWTGHTCMVEPKAIIAIMEKLGYTNYKLNFLKIVKDSNDKCIHSINGLKDRHKFNRKIDPPKRMNVRFDKNIYKEFELIYTL